MTIGRTNRPLPPTSSTPVPASTDSAQSPKTSQKKGLFQRAIGMVKPKHQNINVSRPVASFDEVGVALRHRKAIASNPSDRPPALPPRLRRDRPPAPPPRSTSLNFDQPPALPPRSTRLHNQHLPFRTQSSRSAFDPLPQLPQGAPSRSPRTETLQRAPAAEALNQDTYERPAPHARSSSTNNYDRPLQHQSPDYLEVREGRQNTQQDDYLAPIDLRRQQPPATAQDNYLDPIEVRRQQPPTTEQDNYLDPIEVRRQQPPTTEQDNYESPYDTAASHREAAESPYDTAALHREAVESPYDTAALHREGVEKDDTLYESLYQSLNPNHKDAKQESIYESFSKGRPPKKS